MSDIEDYAYSPYDDLDDILYDADPAPELADDLAGHSVPSPVYQDEIAGYELEDYHSDWEYYSDDYMDDDPTLLKKNPQDGSDPKKSGKAKGEAKTEKRGKKRKFTETINVQPDDEELLVRNIQGTLWAKPPQPRTPPYNTGGEVKVALMKNWKELFAIKDDGWGRGTGEAEEDESWAKDMSLADMGLQNMQGMPRDHNVEDENPEAEEEDEEEGDDADDDREEEEYMEADEVDEGDEIDIVPEMEPKPPPSNTESAAYAEEHVDEEDLPRKRRRLRADPTKPSPSPGASTVQVADSHARSTTPGSHTRSTTAEKNTRGPVEQGLSKQIRSPTANGPVSTTNRKRKATEEPEDRGLSRSTASSRAKRIASTESRTTLTVTETTRRTRSSKK
ncbi:hypothetical protein LTR47_008994 [Exophiala xenobiotica]|nr:hypothetical protein LTR47_008994 [Exophiala xenobiotica]KAK5363974.1 hypothetical protein LTR11_008972 [Exophiala xenobiotica]